MAIGGVDVSIVMVQVQINNLYKKCTLSIYSDVRKKKTKFVIFLKAHLISLSKSMVMKYV